MNLSYEEMFQKIRSFLKIQLQMSSLKTYKQDDQFLELVNMNRMSQILEHYKE